MIDLFVLATALVGLTIMGILIMIQNMHLRDALEENGAKKKELHEAVQELAKLFKGERR